MHDTAQPKKASYHVLQDTASRSTVVGYFDGAKWWMPGSEKSFEADSVMMLDGSNPGGRFNQVSEVNIPGGVVDWKPEYGRFE